MDAGIQRIELSARNSLDPRQTRLFLLGVGAGCLAIGLLWTARGLWPVLPFAGLEVLVLYLALKLNQRRALRAQTILISEAEVRVVKRETDGSAAEVVFPRYWTRVKLAKSVIASHPNRLTLEYSGKSCEVGEFLTEDRRSELARQLRGLVGRLGEIPLLRPDPPG